MKSVYALKLVLRVSFRCGWRSGHSGLPFWRAYQSWWRHMSGLPHIATSTATVMIPWVVIMLWGLVIIQMMTLLRQSRLNAILSIKEFKTF
jgi:hypothetical protein